LGRIISFFYLIKRDKKDEREDVPMNITERHLCSLIDHTCLKADAGKKDIAKLCQEAIEYQFKAVCVNPVFVKQAAQTLRGSSVVVCTVVGFPLGAVLSQTKVFETAAVVKNGAGEVDAVINIGALKDGQYEFVLQEIKEVVKAAEHAPVKIIIEACLLTDQEKEQACLLALEGGAHFVKTSTGFSYSGATTADVSLMRRVVGNRAGVKAAGGIRDKNTALAMIAAGADRIGTSSGPAIING